MRTRMRIPAALAALIACLALAACGEKEEAPGQAERVQLDLMLDWFVNPDHAGIYQAIERGDFEEAGLDISPRVPSDPSAPVRLVAQGRADLAISYEPEVLIARDQGLPVVAVAALVREPLTSLISLPDAGISHPADLRGKTIVTAGIPYQTAFLDAILEQEGISRESVDQVEVGHGLMPALLSGRADAMLGGFRNIEGVDLAERGRRPRVVPVDELGIPTYNELVLVAHEDVVADDSEPIRLFVGALERGTRDAVRNPEQAIAAILEHGEGLDERLTAAEVEATLPLLLPRSQRPYGFMDSRAWEDFAGFLADRGVTEARIAPGDALTNELLPGEVPD